MKSETREEMRNPTSAEIERVIECADAGQLLKLQPVEVARVARCALVAVQAATEFQEARALAGLDDHWVHGMETADMRQRKELVDRALAAIHGADGQHITSKDPEWWASAVLTLELTLRAVEDGA